MIPIARKISIDKHFQALWFVWLIDQAFAIVAFEISANALDSLSMFDLWVEAKPGTLMNLICNLRASWFFQIVQLSYDTTIMKVVVKITAAVMRLQDLQDSGCFFCIDLWIV
jgi:hypothetical protein